MSDDEARIRAVIEAHGDRLRAADVHAVVDLYTDDAIVMQPDAPTTAAREALIATYEGALGAMKMNFTLEVDDVLVDGTIAAVCTPPGRSRHA